MFVFFVLFCLSCGDLPNQPSATSLVLLESPPWVEVQQGGFIMFRPVWGRAFDFLKTNQVWAFGRKKLRDPWGSGFLKKLKLTREPTWVQLFKNWKLRVWVGVVISNYLRQLSHLVIWQIFCEGMLQCFYQIPGLSGWKHGILLKQNWRNNIKFKKRLFFMKT